MKSFILCAIIAVSAIQLVRGDGYAPPTETYTYDYSGGYGGSTNVATGVCGGIVVNLGILGCTDAINDYLNGGSDLNCVNSCSSYISNLVVALRAQGAITVQARGTVAIVAGYGVSAAGGAVVGVGGAVGLLVSAVSIKAVAGAVIGGVLGGVSGTFEVVLSKLNIAIELAARARFTLSCAASSQCKGYTAPTYA